MNRRQRPAPWSVALSACLVVALLLPVEGAAHASTRADGTPQPGSVVQDADHSGGATVQGNVVLPEGATVGAQVTLGVINPQSNELEPATDLDGAAVPPQEVDSGGAFSFGDLPPGTYVARAIPPSGASVSSPVAAATVTARGFALAALEGDPVPLSVSGTVTAAGTVLQGATVTLLMRDQYNGGWYDTGILAITDANGAYTIDAVDAGAYALRVVGPDSTWATTYYGRSGSTSNPAKADEVVVDSFSGPLTGLDVALIKASGASGRVIGPGGSPMSGIVVSALDATDGSMVLASAETDATGNFTLSLPVGSSVKLQASSGGISGLSTRFWKDASTFAEASVIEVQEGAALTGVNFDLTAPITFPPLPTYRFLVPRAPAGLASLPLDNAPWEGATTCAPVDKPGAIAMSDLLHRVYGNEVTIGLSRGCVAGKTSEHYEGRAVDWMVNSRDDRQAAMGDTFVRWLTANEGLEAGAMARRLGVMYIIWRGKMWRSYDPERGWTDYSSCTTNPAMFGVAQDNTCHRNHVHMSLNWAGAGKTASWWTLPEAVPLAASPSRLVSLGGRMYTAAKIPKVVYSGSLRRGGSVVVPIAGAGPVPKSGVVSVKVRLVPRCTAGGVSVGASDRPVPKSISVRCSAVGKVRTLALTSTGKLRVVNRGSRARFTVTVLGWTA